MTQILLHSLLHISDLHIAELASTGDALLDAGTLRYWQTFPLLEGHLGHTHVALVQLSRLLLHLREEGNVSVIVTGDLTANGAQAQFGNSRGFLDGRRGASPVGLNLKGQRETIPGNHDHWPGTRCKLLNSFTCMLGPESPSFSTTFPAMPYVSARVPLTPNCHLRIAGLDSDADVAKVSTMRLWARGSFASQCVSLAAQLGANPGNELRVLLVHHSFAPGFMLGIDDRSRAAFSALVEAAGIKIVLTGHKHAADSRPTANGSFHEFRCGTTTQRDFFPPDWNQPTGRLRRNSALVHRIYESDGRIVWQTDLWRRRTDHGVFENMHRLAALNPWP